jgi:hypothetical protein
VSRWRADFSMGETPRGRNQIGVNPKSETAS